MHFISEYTKGDRVLLHHLSTNKLNGKIGTIDKPFLTRRGRWSEKLEDGSCRNVKSSNLRLATESDEEALRLAAEVAKEAEENGQKMEVGEQEEVVPSKSEDNTMDEEDK